MFDWIEWSNPVAIWWLALVAASAFNIAIWFWLRYYRFQGVSAVSILRIWENPQSVIWLSGLYVFVCAFRSILPRADVQKICLFDTWLSSVLVGRSLATVAELAFVAQWSIILGIVGAATNDRWIRQLSRTILIVIGIAEGFSWYAVITTHYLGNSVEESLWGVTYFMITIAVVRLWFRFKGPMRLAAGFCIPLSAAYVGFMFTVDVPMYLSRLSADSTAGKVHFGLIEGLMALATQWHVTHSIEDWKTEIPWMTLYFTFAVLVSLALCLLPLRESEWKKHLRDT